MRRTVIASASVVALLVTSIALADTGSAVAHGDKHGNGHGGHEGHNNTSQTGVVESDEPLANSCDDELLANLELHDGFQPGVGTQAVDPRCVEMQMGAVSAFEDNPALLIVKSPLYVRKGQDIVLKVSTRNLVRDRFLGAADGGYYVESGTLQADGLTRGHFHTGCRLLDGKREAPKAERLGERFIATEDNKGSATPDVVTVTIPGFDKRGIVQCAAWAGDGSHRMPMMSFANTIPAFDAVRIVVG
jgi:hypothetical protein